MNEEQLDPRKGALLAAIGAGCCIILAAFMYAFVLGKEPMMQIDAVETVGSVSAEDIPTELR
jgi:hypothetical protein